MGTIELCAWAHPLVRIPYWLVGRELLESSAVTQWKQGELRYLKPQKLNTEGRLHPKQLATAKSEWEVEWQVD